MSLLKVGDVVSRLRYKLKGHNMDLYLTDRTIFSLLLPHINQELKRLDEKDRLMAFNSLFETLDIVPLVEVDKIEAKCGGLQSGVKIMRTEKPIPVFMEGYWGPMIRSLTSIDGSVEMQPITPAGYLKISKLKTFKYNTTKYYWYLNDFIYCPNIPWPALRAEAMVLGDISEYKCNYDEKCLPFQEKSLAVPDYSLQIIEENTLKSLGITFQIPPDTSNDNSSVRRK